MIYLPNPQIFINFPKIAHITTNMTLKVSFECHSLIFIDFVMIS